MLRVILFLFIFNCNGNNTDTENNKRSQENKKAQEAGNTFHGYIESVDLINESDINRMATLIKEIGIFDIKFETTQHDTILTFALKRSKVKIADLVLQSLSQEENKQKVKEFVNHKTEDKHAQAIHIAILYGDLEAVKFLLNLGADINSQNIDGNTPLHLAAFYNRIEIAKFLLSNNADKEILNVRNNTPLGEAKRFLDHDHTEMIRILE